MSVAGLLNTKPVQIVIPRTMTAPAPNDIFFRFIMYLEATAGFEPANGSFADSCVSRFTTWPFLLALMPDPDVAHGVPAVDDQRAERTLEYSPNRFGDPPLACQDHTGFAGSSKTAPTH